MFQVLPCATLAMSDVEKLTQAWEAAAPALEEDPMRVTRYKKCFRYFWNSPRDAKILDVGCGEGSGLAFLEMLGFRNLFGVEVSHERLRVAANKVKSAKLQLIGPAEDLPYEQGYFDIVLSAGVIEHTLDRIAFTRELARVTKDGGQVIVSSDAYMWRVLQFLKIYNSVQPIDRAPFPLMLLREFSICGFTLVHSEGFALPGHEYRFAKLLLTKLPNPIKAVLRKCFRAARRSFGSNETHFETPEGLEQQSEPWEPNTIIAALPGLLFSDETVFLLKKMS